MDFEVFRITPDNATCLRRVDPDIFDHQIDLERTFAFVATPFHLRVVSRIGDLVVGQIRAMIHLQPDGPNQLYIDNLGVAPAQQRRGIATALLHDVFSWGRENACADAWVATEPDNAAAHSLYDRFRNMPEQAMAYLQMSIA
jgi:ribosomal protein S18 acetylase RimI-like enzyme